MKSTFSAIDSFYYFAVFGAEQKHFSCLYALSVVPGTQASENKLRETVKVIRSSFSLSLDIREVNILFCYHCKNTSTKHAGLWACLGALQTPRMFFLLHRCSLASSIHAASSSRAVQDDEEESDDDDDAEEDEEEGAEEEHGEEEEEDDEEEEYDDDDGPPTTQTTQREKRNMPKKDWKSPSPFQKARPTHRKKAAEKRSENNEDRTAKRGRKD